MKKLKQACGVVMVLVLMSVFAAWVFAGDMEPSADPAPTMHSLVEIYNKLKTIDGGLNKGVAKTGQTTSYATGDDGDLQEGIAWPPPRFSDNGDGSVTDNLTGLIWLQDANRFGQRNWTDALADCNSLADDGVDLTDGSVAGDWRLPNVKELFSLIDFGRHSPGLPTGHPFSNVQLDWYLSSTTLASGTNSAILIHIDGDIMTDNKDFAGRYAWPVRSGD